MEQSSVINAEKGITVEDLLFYGKKLLKNWWVIALSAILLAAIGFTAATLTDVKYYSSQIMFVASNKDTSLVVSGQSSSDLSASVTLAESYQYVFTTTELSQKVANNCGWDVSAQDVKSFISVQPVEETAIVYLTVTTTNPEVSYAIADTYVRFYEEAITTAFPSTRLTVIDPPLLPEQPNANNNKLIYTALGFLSGAVLAALVIVCIVAIKDTVKSSDDIKTKLNLKIIGSVNHVPSKGKKDDKSSVLITDRRSGFAFIESFKLIRTKFDHILLRKGQKALVVTSTEENEGKTTTAINIALALAKNGKEVLLIDGDLRKPAIAKALNINANEDLGIFGIVNGSRDLADSIKYSEKYNLYLLLSGKTIPDSAEVLSSSQMGEIIARAKQEFDYVVIDTAPCGVVADASILAGFSDAIVMVIRQDTVSTRRIKRALENLDNSGTEIVGCIYNDAKSGIGGSTSRRYGYGGYGYGYGYGEQKSGK